MDKFELDNIIKSLDDCSSKEDAYFEFVDEEGSYIKANKDGVFQFSRQLLKSLKLFEDKKNSKDKSITLEGGEWLINPEYYPFIEPIYLKRKDIKNGEVYKETWKDNIFKIGCVSALIILGVSALIGFISLVTWIIDLF